MQFVLVAMLPLLLSGVAFAQLSTAQLDGRVSDESAGVLPGATVTVTQTDTGLTRTVVTNADGTYVIPALPTGPYEVMAELPGFTTYVQTGLVLQVGDTATINMVLPLGGLQETVTVEAASPLVDVRSAGISEVVENERILELPLEGRQVTDLIILAGGAVEGGVNSNRSVNGSARVSVGGGLSYGVTYSLDGALHLNFQDNLGLPLPFPDALQEFSVSSGGLSAQNGVHSAGAVNAVTKSGSNRFSGGAFEFFRDRRFNATDNFASLGDDGEPEDDGLNRHQFGGTLGGPIVPDKVFFFGGYQGTRLRSIPTSFIRYVPTAEMLAGDFRTFASAQCNRRAVRLGAPFVNNQVDPSQFAAASVRIAALLPSTTDPCGEVTFGIPTDEDAWQGVGRIDIQASDTHTMFGRWLRTFTDEFPVWDPSDPSASVLTTQQQGRDRTAGAMSITGGDTLTIGSNKVNALRVAYNSADILSVREPWFDAPSLGINNTTAFPGKMALNITGGFNIGHPSGINSDMATDIYSVGDDFTWVTGNHQVGIGASFAYWEMYMELNARSVGTYTFDGNETGLGLADFMTGKLFRLEQSDPQILNIDQTYIGTYVQDAWRASDRVTVNMGVRWEPYLGQSMRNVTIPIFSLDAFDSGQVSNLFSNAPAGLRYPGDTGYPNGSTGLSKKWLNISPRFGVAWDVNGNGRTAVRSSYALAYDMPTGDFFYVGAGAAPYASRIRIEERDFMDPWAAEGGTPFPHQIPPPVDAPFINRAAFETLDPDINSPRVQNWNVTVEQQLGTSWSVSASYLGSHHDRLWGLVAINPGVFNPGGRNTRGNLNARRFLSLRDPVKGLGFSSIDEVRAVGTQDYHGVKLSVRRRSAGGVSLSGNYTLADCVGNTTPTGFSQFSSGYKDPTDVDYDRGNCNQTRRHVGNATFGYQTPEFGGALGALASNWRFSGILSARSGSFLTFTTGRDPAGTGISNQRLNQVSGGVEGGTLESFFDGDALARPAGGTLGELIPGAFEGPGFWTVNLGVSRLIYAGQHQVEFRVEAFNAFNNFNWGNPATNFDRGTFGRIRSQAGDPRIMQFAIKYAF